MTIKPREKTAMYLVDTSVWIKIFRDRTGSARKSFEDLVGDENIYLSRFTQMELLQGCKDDREWRLLQAYLNDQDYIEQNSGSWVDAARIYYDLRRQGLTPRNSIDCCIAGLAIAHELILLHDDRDFELIQQVRSLQCSRLLPTT
ncbi:MAG: Ribonuclease VapC11 [Chroococcopsis gigantea SAG 12.99]|jgi:predicted nucleic acid-binding protein|nr:Ribonuclease VapC11 [Chroococcopsis gigantea SAG 12.99]